MRSFFSNLVNVYKFPVYLVSPVFGCFGIAHKTLDYFLSIEGYIRPIVLLQMAILVLQNPSGIRFPSGLQIG
jgi:hypothetical protein